MNGFDHSDNQRGSSRIRPYNRIDTLDGTKITLEQSDGGIPGRMGFAARMHQLPEDRKHLIFRIRRQIAENNYDTAEKLEIAVERMFDSLAGGASSGRWDD